MSKEIKAKRIGGNDILVMNNVAPKTYEFRIRVMTPRGEILSCEKIEGSREVIEKSDLKNVFYEYYYSLKKKKSSTKTIKSNIMYKFTIDTQLYAGTIAHGYKDRLFQFWLSDDSKKLEIKYAFADIELKSRGQKNVVMEAKCNIDFAIKTDYKGRIEVLGNVPIAEIMENVTEISGNTFEIKDWIKDFGFRWNSFEKNWKK